MTSVCWSLGGLSRILSYPAPDVSREVWDSVAKWNTIPSLHSVLFSLCILLFGAKSLCDQPVCIANGRRRGWMVLKAPRRVFKMPVIMIREMIQDILSPRMRIALKYYDLFVLFVSYRYDYFKVSFTYQETSETRTIQMLLDLDLYS